MSPKKEANKKRDPVKRRFQTSTEETFHYNAVLIEGLRDEFKFVTEAVSGLQESFPRQMNEMETRLQENINDVKTGLGIRIDSLDQKLSKRIDSVEKSLGERIDKVELGLKETWTELKETRTEVKGIRVELKETRVELKETRTELGGKMDPIQGIVTRHDEEILSINAKIA